MSANSAHIARPFVLLLAVLGVAAALIPILWDALNIAGDFFGLDMAQLFMAGVFTLIVAALLYYTMRSPRDPIRATAWLIVAVGVGLIALALILSLGETPESAPVVEPASVILLGVAWLIVGAALLLTFPRRAVQPAIVAAPSSAQIAAARLSSTSVATSGPESAPVEKPQPTEKAAPVAAPANATSASIEPEGEDADDSEPIPLKRRGLNAPDQELPITARLIAETRAAVVASAPEGADDIEIIEGIGPRIAEALRAGGILTFQQLASATPGELERIVRAQSVRMVGNADTWPRQAQFLVDGDVEGFKAYLSRLIAGRDPDEPQQPE